MPGAVLDPSLGSGAGTVTFGTFGLTTGGWVAPGTASWPVVVALVAGCLGFTGAPVSAFGASASLSCAGLLAVVLLSAVDLAGAVSLT